MPFYTPLGTFLDVIFPIITHGNSTASQTAQVGYQECGILLSLQQKLASMCIITPIFILPLRAVYPQLD